jgi:putative thioredoxin
MSFIVDITEENFSTEVIEASHNTPVLVDFWATWCAPCKTLMPLLTKLAEEYAGQFRLAKIEIDQQQNLASQFSIRSVPTVKIVVKGEVVDEFMGALPEVQIREFIEKHTGQTKGSPLQSAIELYLQGDSAQALEQMQQILLAEPDNPNVRIEFANMLMREKRFDDARDLLNSLSSEDKNLPYALKLFLQLESIDVVLGSPDIQTLLTKIAEDPVDCLAREQLCAHYKLRGDYAAAMDQLLEIVRRDRKYKDDAGRKELLKTFESLGNNHELVGQYRRKLAQLLN